MKRFYFVFVIALLFVASAAHTMEQKSVTFHAKFIANINELHVTIPTNLIEPTLKAHYQYLDGRELSQAESELFLEMYLRETVKLQFGAFPMALGESGVSHENGTTKLVMKLASLPKEANGLMVQINSFADHPKQKNLFKITKSLSKQSFALSSANSFSANVAL